jgi:hypothetical protein
MNSPDTKRKPGGRPGARAALRIGAFLLRHLVAVPVLTLVLCLGWVLVYLVLLVVAAVTDSGIGGPLALPAGLIFFGVAGVVLGWGVFAPACAVGAALCTVFRLPGIAAIPFVWLSALGFSYAVFSFAAHIMTIEPAASASAPLLLFALGISIPLGIYWWLTEGPWALLELGKRWWTRRRRD